MVQLSYLFNEPECMSRESAPEADVEAIAVKAHARKVRRSGLPPVFVPTSELVKTVSWHPHSFIGLATS